MRNYSHNYAEIVLLDSIIYNWALGDRKSRDKYHGRHVRSEKAILLPGVFILAQQKVGGD